MKAYLLEHAYEYGEKLEHTEAKTIGIYESRESAEKTVVRIYLVLANTAKMVFI